MPGPVYEYDQFGQPIGIMSTGTIGDYTGYDMGSAPMQPLPTLPQTYAPTPGNPNYPVLTTSSSTFGIPGGIPPSFFEPYSKPPSPWAWPSPNGPKKIAIGFFKSRFFKRYNFSTALKLVASAAIP